MFDYNSLTAQEKLRFQNAKIQLYEETILSETPDFNKIDACYKELEALGYMETVPRLDVQKSFARFKKECLNPGLCEDWREEQPAVQRRLSPKTVRVLVVAAVLFVIMCMAVFANNTVELDIWQMLNGESPTAYVYDENIKDLCDDVYVYPAEFAGVYLKL